MEVTKFYDEKWEDFLDMPKEAFFEGYGIRLDGVFKVVMKTKFALQLFLSTVCILFNGFFVTFLLSKKQFRSWMFFPLILQSIIDIFSAGFMNVLFENVRRLQILQLVERQIVWVGEPRAAIHDIMFLSRLRVTVYCFLGFSRMLLNEYSTGYCILTIAFFRYMGVCRPFSGIPKNFHRRISFILLAFVVLSISGMVVAVIFDNHILFDIDDWSKQLESYENHRMDDLDLLDRAAMSQNLTS